MTYMISIVPTSYVFASGEIVQTSQYSYTVTEGSGFPGMWRPGHPVFSDTQIKVILLFGSIN